MVTPNHDCGIASHWEAASLVIDAADEKHGIMCVHYDSVMLHLKLTSYICSIIYDFALRKSLKVAKGTICDLRRNPDNPNVQVRMFILDEKSSMRYTIFTKKPVLLKNRFYDCNNRALM